MSLPDPSPRWYAYPFRPRKRPGFALVEAITGSPCTGGALAHEPGRIFTVRYRTNAAGIPSEDFYIPTDDEQAVVRSRYPQADVERPPWEQIQADLIRAGLPAASCEGLSAPVIIAMLEGRQAARDAGQGKPTEPVEAGPKIGPGEEYVFYWAGRPCELEIEPKSWKLLIFLWGKPSVSVADVAAAVWKNKRTGYATMKPTVTRLNNAMQQVKGLNVFWTKKRGENRILYNGPRLDSSVST